MASLHSSFIHARSAFFVLAQGTPEDAQTSKTVFLTPVNKDTLKYLSYLGDTTCKELDIHRLHHAFNTKSEADAYCKKILKGEHRIYEHTEVKQNTIRVEEFGLDMRLVEFNDDDHELMGIAAAIDSLGHKEQRAVLEAFPILKEIEVKYSVVPPDVQTHDGRAPSYLYGGYIRVTPEKRAEFLKTAENFDINTPAATTYAKFFTGYAHPASIHYVATDIGRIKLGLSTSKATEPLAVRLYSYNNTFTPKPTIDDLNKQEKEQLALSILKEQPTQIAYAILSALQARGYARQKPKMLEGMATSAILAP